MEGGGGQKKVSVHQIEYLLEANVSSILSKALPAGMESVFSDQSMPITAYPTKEKVQKRLRCHSTLYLQYNCSPVPGSRSVFPGMTVPHVVVPHRGLTSLAHTSSLQQEKRGRKKTWPLTKKRATKRMRASLWAGLIKGWRPLPKNYKKNNCTTHSTGLFLCRTHRLKLFELASLLWPLPSKY